MTCAEKHESLDRPSPENPKKGSSQLTPELFDIKARLMPLIDVEKTLICRLTTAGSGEGELTQGNVTPDQVVSSKQGLTKVAINSTIPWKNAFNRFTRTEKRASFDSSYGIDWGDLDDPGAILNNCSEDMIQLWNNPNIKQLLVKQNMRAEELSGLYVIYFPSFR